MGAPQSATLLHRDARIYAEGVKGGGRDARLALILPVAALLEAVLLVRNMLTLTPPASTVMLIAQILVVVGFLGLWWWVARQDSLGEVVQRILPAILIPVGLLLPFEQALTGNGLLAANLALLLVVGGALIVDGFQFILTCVCLVGGWVIAISTRTMWTVSISDQVALVVLGCAIGTAVFLLRNADRRRLEQARDVAFASAMRDHLTSLWNRRGLNSIVPSMIGAAHENGTGIWCLFIDVRGLKKVNDSHGHAAGDRLLIAVGTSLASTIVMGGVPARWGGDEFCVVGVGGPPVVPLVYQDLVAGVARCYQGPRDWDLSLGSSYEKEPAEGFLDHLVAQADEDMYRRRGQTGLSLT